jgi:hypothetical protein
MNEQRFLQQLLEIIEVNQDVDWDFAESTPQEEFNYLATLIADHLEAK